MDEAVIQRLKSISTEPPSLEVPVTLYSIYGKKPFCKSYRLEMDGQTITSTDHPKIVRVTSKEWEVRSLTEFADVIKQAGDAGHALVKGQLTRDVVDESWAGTTQTDMVTQWMVLDLDGVDYKSSGAAIKDLGLDDVSYIEHYSASSGIKDGLRCHCFMVLDKPLTPDQLRDWFTTKNYQLPKLMSGISLAKGHKTLKYPLDRLSCMNGRVIYIAPPEFDGVIPDPHRHYGRILVRNSSLQAVPTDRLIQETWSGEELVKHRQYHVDRLRVMKGLPPILTLS